MVSRLVFGLVALIALGCSSRNERHFTWDQVRQLKVGMSRQEVRNIMGAPSYVIQEDGRECWEWVYTSRWDGMPRQAWVDVVSGKVNAFSHVDPNW
jgi:outer membrane protein assembly factor BamE (lipoprotein component of BamABCDE complex)